MRHHIFTQLTACRQLGCHFCDAMYCAKVNTRHASRCSYTCTDALTCTRWAASQRVPGSLQSSRSGFYSYKLSDNSHCSLFSHWHRSFCLLLVTIRSNLLSSVHQPVPFCQIPDFGFGSFSALQLVPVGYFISICYTFLDYMYSKDLVQFCSVFWWEIFKFNTINIIKHYLVCGTSLCC